MANCKRQLTLVRGTDEISLDFGEYGTTEYNRRVAEVGGVGEKIGTVDEAIKLVITGATDVNILNSIQKAGQWLIDARRREKIGTGDRVYIRYTPEKSTVTWQAELLKGRLEVINREGFIQLQCDSNAKQLPGLQRERFERNQSDSTMQLCGYCGG